MNSYLRASVISFYFGFFSIICLAQEDARQARIYENCEDAKHHAKIDVLQDSLIFYGEKVRFDWHNKYDELSEVTTDRIRRADLFDSLMWEYYNIRVDRSVNYFYNQISINCYNAALLNHMDTMFGKGYQIEVYNKIAEINGEEPYFSEEEIKMIRSKD